MTSSEGKICWNYTVWRKGKWLEGILVVKGIYVYKGTTPHGNGHPPPYISTNNAEISRFSGEISLSDPDCTLLELHGPEFHLFVVFQRNRGSPDTRSSATGDNHQCSPTETPQKAQKPANSPSPHRKLPAQKHTPPTNPPLPYTLPPQHIPPPRAKSLRSLMQSPTHTTPWRRPRNLPTQTWI
jgi:hypothetical protein